MQLHFYITGNMNEVLKQRTDHIKKVVKIHGVQSPATHASKFQPWIVKKSTGHPQSGY